MIGAQKREALRKQFAVICDAAPEDFNYRNLLLEERYEAIARGAIKKAHELVFTPAEESRRDPAERLVKAANVAVRAQRRLDDPIVGNEVRELAIAHIPDREEQSSILALNAVGGDYESLQYLDRGQSGHAPYSDTVESHIVEAAGKFIGNAGPDILNTEALLIGFNAVDRLTPRSSFYWQSCAYLGVALRGFPDDYARL